jgi:hypothetical protein
MSIHAADTNAALPQPQNTDNRNTTGLNKMSGLRSLSDPLKVFPKSFNPTDPLNVFQGQKNGDAEGGWKSPPLATGARTFMQPGLQTKRPAAPTIAGSRETSSY